MSRSSSSHSRETAWQPPNAHCEILSSWIGLTAFLLCAFSWSVELSLGQQGATLKITTPSTQNTPATNTLSDSVVSSQAIASPAAASPVADQNGTQSSTTDSEVTTDAEIRDNIRANPSSRNHSDEHLGSDEPVELSVEPGSQPILPANRPAWIGADPDYTGDIHRLYVGSTAVSEREEVDSALDFALITAVNRYLEDKVLQKGGSASDLLLDASYIRRNLINEAHGCVLELSTSSGPMYQKWVTIEITPEQREQLQQRYREALQRQRMVPLGTGLAGILGLVGLSHLILRSRHGLPTTQPLYDDSLAANHEVVNERRTKKAGLFVLVFLMLGAISLGIMLLASLLFYVGVKSHSVVPGIDLTSGHAGSSEQIIRVGSGSPENLIEIASSSVPLPASGAKRASFRIGSQATSQDGRFERQWSYASEGQITCKVIMDKR